MVESGAGVDQTGSPVDPTRWYALQTYSGHEKKVKTLLEQKIEEYGLDALVATTKGGTPWLTAICTSPEAMAADIAVPVSKLTQLMPIPISSS